MPSWCSAFPGENLGQLLLFPMAGLDRATLCEFFTANRGGLILFAGQLLGAHDQSAAEDMVQELLVRLLTRTAEPGGLALPPNLPAWVYLALRNACLDERRSNYRRRAREVSAAVSQDWFEPRTSDLIDAGDAQAAAESLPQPLREVLVLRLWSGLTLAETADVVGRPVSTVHDQYRSAIATIRQLLEERKRHVRRAH